MNRKHRAGEPSEIDRARLLKFLRLLSSDHIGERAAAATKAAELVARFGGWERFIVIQRAPQPDHEPFRNPFEEAQRAYTSQQRDQYEDLREAYGDAFRQQGGAAGGFGGGGASSDWRDKARRDAQEAREKETARDAALLASFDFTQYPHGACFHGLTDWELQFVKSCHERVGVGRSLSEKQITVLIRCADIVARSKAWESRT